MSSAACVIIHPSQFPDAVRRDLLESLRARKVNHKFHYDSIKQTQKWLALHEAYSPARTDADCLAIYDDSFIATAKQISAKNVHLIGLGCGGGKKDARLLQLLREAGKNVEYTPSDVSVAMVLVARETALPFVDNANCHPLVCDLATADDLPAVLGVSLNEGAKTSDGESPSLPRSGGEGGGTCRAATPGSQREPFHQAGEMIAPFSGSLPAPSRGEREEGSSRIMSKSAPVLSTQVDKHAARLITFFGMIPNFEPQQILPGLAALLRPGDHLLFSANLAPGSDYAVGVQRVLPLYDNALTRDWLMTFLTDLGVERDDGEMRFSIEDDAGSGLKRITAHFYFQRDRRIQVENETFDFCAGESIRLFFSYRHTPDRVRALLSKHGLKVIDQWVTKSEEEGVFSCVKELS